MEVDKRQSQTATEQQLRTKEAHLSVLFFLLASLEEITAADEK
jgi:hypothetical protein